MSLNSHTELPAAQVHPSDVGRTSLIPLPQALLLGYWRGAAAGEKVETLLSGCSLSASVGQPLPGAAISLQRHAGSELFNKGRLVTAFVFS